MDGDRSAERSPCLAASVDPDRAGPLARLPAGTAFGTLVHAVFEHVDFSAGEMHRAARSVPSSITSWPSTRWT